MQLHFLPLDPVEQAGSHGDRGTAGQVAGGGDNGKPPEEGRAGASERDWGQQNVEHEKWRSLLEYTEPPPCVYLRGFPMGEDIVLLQKGAGLLREGVVVPRGEVGVVVPRGEKEEVAQAKDTVLRVKGALGGVVLGPWEK